MKRLILTSTVLASLAKAAANPVIATCALDPDKPIIVPTAANITTTLEFPNPVQGIDGVGLASAPKANAQILFSVSHVPGTRFVSFTPLTSTASTNVNFIYQDEVYVFILKVDVERALFKMSLTDPAAELSKSREEEKAERQAQAKNQPIPEERDTLRVSPARMLGLMDKIKGYHVLKQNPANVEDLDRREGKFEPSETPDYKIQPLSVTRKGAWDALVFEVAVTNKTTAPIFYDPESFLVAVGPRSYTSIMADAGGVLPAGQTTTAYFIIQGDSAQGSNNLSPDNAWLISLQEVVQGPSLMPQHVIGKEPLGEWEISEPESEHPKK